MLKGILITLLGLPLNCLLSLLPLHLLLCFHILHNLILSLILERVDLCNTSRSPHLKSSCVCLLDAAILSMCQHAPQGLLFKTGQHLLATIDFLFFFSSSHTSFQHVPFLLIGEEHFSLYQKDASSRVSLTCAPEPAVQR